MNKSAIQFLHLTDCHLLPDDGAEIYGTDTFRALESVLNTALGGEPPEFVVVTGDLSEDGSDASYQRLKALLLNTQLPVYVTAGNHDSPDAMHRSLLCESIRMTRQIDIGPWRVVFLDSRVDGAAYGCLDHEELAFLKESLVEGSDRYVAACLHHSPIKPCPSSGCQLKNDEQLLSLLAASAQARLVFAGHAHVEQMRHREHVTVLTTPATSSECRHAQLGESVDHEDFWSSHTFDGSRHGFRTITLHPAGGIDTQVHWVGS